MKIGSLVKTRDNRIGIVYYHSHCNPGSGTSDPWYVYMMDNNWTVEYFKASQLEVLNV